MDAFLSFTPNELTEEVFNSLKALSINARSIEIRIVAGDSIPDSNHSPIENHSENDVSEDNINLEDVISFTMDELNDYVKKLSKGPEKG